MSDVYTAIAGRQDAGNDGRDPREASGLFRAAESEDNRFVHELSIAVVMRTEIGGSRILERPYGELLPRIC